MSLLPVDGQEVTQRPPLEVTWHSFDLRTGRRGQQLHVQTNGNPSRILCTVTELELAIRIWDRDAEVPGWDADTLPGRVMLVALDENENPLWGGMAYRRVSGAGPWVSVYTATLEAYFDRRYVKDHTFSFVEQTAIAAGVIADAVTDGVELVVDADATIPRLREREYFDDEDKTVLAVLNELAEIESGIEFTIDLEWTDDTRTQLARIVRIRERIGTGSNTPTATFSLPGSVTDFQYVEDYSPENGANAVQATSSGEGDTRPESAWQTPNPFPDGWVRYERKIQPSTSITRIATLNLHARRELLETWDGLKELTLEAHADTAPRIGTDWFLGDDVGVSLTCPRFPERTNADGAIVPGYQAVVRAIGWELDLEARRIKPRLLEADEVDVEAL